MGTCETQRLCDLRVGGAKYKECRAWERWGSFIPRWEKTHFTVAFLASNLSSLFALNAPLGGLSGLPGAHEQPATQPPVCRRACHPCTESQPLLDCRSVLWWEAHLRACLEATGVSRGSSWLLGAATRRVSGPTGTVSVKVRSRARTQGLMGSTKNSSPWEAFPFIFRSADWFE